MPKTYFIEDNYNRAFRVWREDNPGDCFALIKWDDAAPVKDFVFKLCEAHPNIFIYGEPPDDEDTDPTSGMVAERSSN